MSAYWMFAALAIGGILSGFYFGGLWLTVQAVAKARQPALLLLASFVIRAGLVLAGFFLVMGGRWEPLAVSMAGFLMARAVMIHRFGGIGRQSAADAVQQAGREPAA